MPSTAEYVILQLALPARPRRNVGVVLLDPESNRIFPKLRGDWAGIAGDEDVEVLAHLEDDLRARGDELGGRAVLEQLEDTLSNALQITAREPVAAGNIPNTLQRLFEEHVQKSKVIQFVTHLPVYSLRAAATRFGEDMEVEAEDWIAAPEGLRLSENMFVARVVGRSMEPRIPDGSLCVFRAGVVGSRQGKLLLVRVAGASESGGEFTVKKYSSAKSGGEQWRHESIVLRPLNPEFQAMKFSPDDEQRQFSVIAEFVEVLGS